MGTETHIEEAGLFGGPRWRRLLWGLACAALLAHGALVLRHFPVSTFVRNRPLTSGDLSFHFAHAVEGRNFIRSTGAVWGYSPTFMAGYPFGLWNSFGRRIYEFAGAFLPLSLPHAFYVTIVGMALLTPVLLALAALACGLGWAVTACTFILGVAAYQTADPLSYFWTFGNLAFPFTCALALLFGAVFYRAVAARSWPAAAGAGLLMGAVFWAHPMAMLPAVVAGVVALAVNARELRAPATLGRVALGGGLALAVALPWALPLLRHMDLRSVMAVDALPGGARYAVMDLLSDRAYGHPFDRRTMFHVLGVLAVLGALAGPRRMRRPAAFMTIGALVLFICAHAFHYSDLLRQTQSYRYVLSCIVFLIVPAAVGVAALVRLLGESNRAGRIAALAVGVMLLPALTAHVFDLLARPQAATLRPDQSAAVEAAQEAVSGGGRLFCEDPELGDTLPFLTGKEVIGGAVSYQSTVAGQPVSAGWSTAFGRPLSELTPDALADDCARYDVTCAIASTEPMARLFEGMGDRTALEAHVGQLYVFRLRPGPQGLQKGVEAGPGRIVVHGATAPSFVLKYNYYPFLRASGGRIGPAPQPDGLPPMIRVEAAGGSDVTITDR